MMADGHIDLDRCRILISNDDGIAAPGLDVLERIARDLCGDVWVVAPEQALRPETLFPELEARGCRFEIHTTTASEVT